MNRVFSFNPIIHSLKHTLTQKQGLYNKSLF